ncbi:hypothetical protein B9479_007357 [Cryptococcus floricola]|uniref:GLTSCR protein conserved domain-containing protein n=1 Tax=Cryptococcus floricola TaxID=2591691 RepID=A0A5D3AQT6_9TREE|nr:hypothetical protein B9479_007357 [Cryptococcus floricola]
MSDGYTVKQETIGDDAPEPARVMANGVNGVASGSGVNGDGQRLFKREDASTPTPTARGSATPTSYTSTPSRHYAPPPPQSLQNQQQKPVQATPKPFPGQVDAEQGSSTGGSGWEKQLAGRKRKWGVMGFGKDEQEALADSWTSLHLAVELDQDATLNPPPPTRFTSVEDAVQRLLPYHIWQVHDEELNTWDKADVARETKEASELLLRLKNIKSRFAKALLREDDRPAPLPSAINFLQTSQSAVRDQVSYLQSNLRQSKQQWSYLDQEQRRVAEVRRKAREDEEAMKRVVGMAMQEAVRPLGPGSGGTGSRPSIPAQQARPPIQESPTKRTRGRPPGTGRLQLAASSGLNLQAVASPNGNSIRSAAGSPGSATGAMTPGGRTGTPTPGVNGAGTPGRPPPPPQGPVSLTINISLLPQLVSIGLIPSTPVQATPAASSQKWPATIIKTLDDKKSVQVSINLGLCTKPQLLSLAKILNVKGSTPSAPSTPSSTTGAGPSQ